MALTAQFHSTSQGDNWTCEFCIVADGGTASSFALLAPMSVSLDRLEAFVARMGTGAGGVLQFGTASGGLLQSGSAQIYETRDGIVQFHICCVDIGYVNVQLRWENCRAAFLDFVNARRAAEIKVLQRKMVALMSPTADPSPGLA